MPHNSTVYRIQLTRRRDFACQKSCTCQRRCLSEAASVELEVSVPPVPSSLLPESCRNSTKRAPKQKRALQALFFSVNSVSYLQKLTFFATIRLLPTSTNTLTTENRISLASKSRARIPLLDAAANLVPISNFPQRPTSD